MQQIDALSACLKRLSQSKIDPLDLIPRRNLVEKLIELVLVGLPDISSQVGAYLEDMTSTLSGVDTSALRVAVLGGGSGLSNIIGGDSRNPGWPSNPFQGIKNIFPKACSIVCVTDDGGSTGEILKDLPLVALGDIRHVLLSSIRSENLSEMYGLNKEECLQTAVVLHRLFNFRYKEETEYLQELINGLIISSSLPEQIKQAFADLLDLLYGDNRLCGLLQRPHCLGNLFLAAAIYKGSEPGETISSEMIVAGINWLGAVIGVNKGAVFPCTTTPAHLKVLYSNGVVVSGESKTATARRNTAVDRVFVEFAGPPQVPLEVFDALSSADIIIFAPGSLYTSIIPILQVPGLVEAVRGNKNALKILVANLWIQKGETDLVLDDPRRRFYVSDLINAYHRNIPGGVKDLFKQIMLLGLQDIPGNILQSYAVEDKVPIYLDRGKVWQMGFTPVEARIFSKAALKERKVQHDPHFLAQAVKTVWAARGYSTEESESNLPVAFSIGLLKREDGLTPDKRRLLFAQRIAHWDIDEALKQELGKIFWRHWDIRQSHLDLVHGIRLIKTKDWSRSMKWDSIYSFYDPIDCCIKIREDVVGSSSRFEGAFLVALGQSLLGNYAMKKEISPVEKYGLELGKVYTITLEPERSRKCYFSAQELSHFLRLARMSKAKNNNYIFTRLISGIEGFTPPGMLMGLVYAWYLDNRYASNIEYKMAITRIPMTGLVREQVIMLNRRMDTVDFFRKVVFRHTSPLYDEQLAPQ